MKEEKVILFFRKHWVVLWKYFLLLFLLGTCWIAGVVTFVIFQISFAELYTSTFSRTIIIALFVFSIYTSIYSFSGLINHFLDVTILTNYRIVQIRKTVFITNTVNTLSLDDVQDIHAIKLGLLENLFGYGSLTVTSATSAMIKQITHIPTPHYYADIITKMKHEKAERYTQRRDTPLPDSLISNNKI